MLGASDNYTPSSSGGAEKAAHEIYLRLGRAGADVKVLSVPHGEPYADPGVQVVAVPGIDLSGLIGGYFCVSPKSFSRAAREVVEHRPQVLHANTIHYNSSVALAHLASRHRLPFVLTAQLGPVTEMPFATRMSGAAYERTVGRYVVRRATRILAVSRTVRAHMIDLGANPANVTVVENGVDHHRFQAEPLDPFDHDPLVLAIGRLVDNKGPQLLVAAAERLAASGRCPRIGFLGDGPMRSELEETVRRAGIQNRVQFHGQVADVERWLASASIVVRPSFTEGLPLAVLEAMAAGRCNIVSAIPPNLELVEHEVNGLAFRPGDVADLAAQLDRAVADGELRAKLGEAGLVSSGARSWDRMAAETASVMVDLAALGART